MPLALLDHKEILEQQAQQDLKAFKVTLVPLDHKDLQVHRAQLVQLVLLDLLEQPEQLALRVFRACKAFRV